MGRMRVDRTMAAWGLVFGVLAILTGVFLLEAVESGFLAEGFFLIVLSWVIVLLVVAKLFQLAGRWSGRRKDE